MVVDTVAVAVVVVDVNVVTGFGQLEFHSSSEAYPPLPPSSLFAKPLTSVFQQYWSSMYFAMETVVFPRVLPLLELASSPSPSPSLPSPSCSPPSFPMVWQSGPDHPSQHKQLPVSMSHVPWPLAAPHWSGQVSESCRRMVVSARKFDSQQCRSA